MKSFDVEKIKKELNSAIKNHKATFYVLDKKGNKIALTNDNFFVEHKNFNIKIQDAEVEIVNLDIDELL